jgi:hypothetical protein
MSWLRDIFKRADTTPRLTTTSYGMTIQQMVRADDPAERERLGDLLAVQLESVFSGQANNVQIALWQFEERQRERVGETNDLVSEAVNLIRGQGAVLNAARAEFRDGMSAIGERVSGVELDVVELKTRMDAAEATLRAHDQSRDASIAERAQHTADLTESKTHRAHMQQTLDRLEAAVARIEQRQLGETEAGG